MRTVIANGTVISATGTHLNTVVVEGERIVALLDPTSSDHDSAITSGARVIDATDKYVIPGGVDVHTHMEMPFGGTESADTFETGSTAAAWGGTTTIIDFAIQQKGGTLHAALDRWHEKAGGHCAIDYGFHMIMTDVNEVSVKEMSVMHDEGVR